MSNIWTLMLFFSLFGEEEFEFDVNKILSELSKPRLKIALWTDPEDGEQYRIIMWTGGILQHKDLNPRTYVWWNEGCEGPRPDENCGKVFDWYRATAYRGIPINPNYSDLTHGPWYDLRPGQHFGFIKVNVNLRWNLRIGQFYRLIPIEK